MEWVEGTLRALGHGPQAPHVDMLDQRGGRTTRSDQQEGGLDYYKDRAGQSIEIKTLGARGDSDREQKARASYLGMQPPPKERQRISSIGRMIGEKKNRMVKSFARVELSRVCKPY